MSTVHDCVIADVKQCDNGQIKAVSCLLHSSVAKMYQVMLIKWVWNRQPGAIVTHAVYYKGEFLEYDSLNAPIRGGWLRYGG